MKLFLLLVLLAQLPAFQPISTPDLSGLEPEVAAQLRDARALLDTLLAREGTAQAELAEAAGDLGRLYHAYGFEEPAAAAYANASRIAPGDFRWPYYLAHLQQPAGKTAEAEASYRRALELRPGYAPALVHLGEVLLSADRADEAEAILKQALADPGIAAAARAALGEVALSRRQFREAAEHLEAALAAAPDADRLHHPLGLAYRGLGEIDKARGHLAQAGRVGVRPADPLMDELDGLRQGEMAHLLRGRVAFRFGRFADAATEFRKAVEARPDSVPARINLGSALAQAGDRKGAMEQLRQALKLAPDNATAHFNLAVLLLQDGALEGVWEGVWEEAAGHLQETVRIDPRDGAAHAELAQLLERAGRLDTALSHYQKAAGFSPQDERAWMGEANLLVRLERYREALEVLESAQGNLPSSGRVLHGLARLLAACPDPALRNGARALELALRVHTARSTATHAETVALATAESGRCEEAARWQKTAVEAARREGSAELVPALESGLARYEQKGPCRPLFLEP